MKRIVICCDGTWNTPDQTDHGMAEPTNVTKLALAIPDTAGAITQRLFYHPGIGTSGSWVSRLYDGFTGSGISDTILEAYRFVIETYEPGDQLFLFGFSRGAFTVRSLAGLMRSCGILRRNAAYAIPKAFRLYRSRTPATHPRQREATLFRRTYAVEEISPIEFIGVWDTVGALGNPLLFGNLSPGNRFHDVDLSTKVRHAFQALAIDEKRRFFEATLWHQQLEAEGQQLEQVWFCGTHSNVGGGYADTGLSDTALEWLVEKARGCGLDVGQISAAPHPLAPNPLGPIVESRRGFYRLIPTYYRPIADPAVAARTCESLHPSVRLRYQERRYRPPNLEAYYKRNPDQRPQLT
jgi:uncharacterized protein (DUF2235 family)